MAVKTQASAAPTEDKALTAEMLNSMFANKRLTETDARAAGLEAGPVAKGFMIAQHLFAGVVSYSKELANTAREIFSADDATCQEASKAMTALRNQARNNAKAHGTLLGKSPKEWERFANSATVRISQMQQVIRATRAGLGIAEVERQTKTKFENLGFDLILDVCKSYNSARAAEHREELEAAGKGRPKLEAMVKLVQYAEKLEPINDDDEKHVQAAADTLRKMAVKMGVKFPEPKKEKANA